MKFFATALLIALWAGCAAARPGASGSLMARRRLSQFTDNGNVQGTQFLRTNRYSRLSKSAADALQSNDAQSAARVGDTTLLTASQASYTAGRTSREDRADLSSNDVQSAVRSGDTMGANQAAQGASALWSNAGGGLRNSVGTRAEIAAGNSQAAIQNSLDNPNDAFRATATGAVQANAVSWPTSYTSWT